MGRIFSRVLTAALVLLVGVYIAIQFYNASASRVKSEFVIAMQFDDDEVVQGLVLREEELITSDKSGVISYDLGNAERVRKDGMIARIYASEEASSAYMELKRINQEISELESVQQVGDQNTVTVETLDKQITECVGQIDKASREGDYQEVEDKKTRLLGLLNRRQIVAQSVTDFNGRLNELKARREECAAKAAAVLDVIASDKAGYFYNVVDGYEGIVDISAITSLTAAQVQELITKGPQQDAAQNAIGKLAPRNEWYYICTLSAERVKQLQVGSTLWLSAPYFISEQIPITVEAVNKEPDGSAAVIFKGNYISEALASFRTQPVTICFKKYDGLKVSTRALRYLDGQMGVYRLEGAVAEFVPVTVQYSGDPYVICKIDTENTDALKLYDEIVIEGRDVHNGKVVNQS